MRATYNTHTRLPTRPVGAPSAVVLGALLLVWLTRGVTGVAERGHAARVCSDHQNAPCLVSVGSQGRVEVPGDARACQEAGCCWGRHPSAPGRGDHEEMCLSAPVSITRPQSSPAAPKDALPRLAPTSATPIQQPTTLPQSPVLTGRLSESEIRERERAMEPYLLELAAMEPRPPIANMPSRDSLPDSIKHITIPPSTQEDQAHKRALIEKGARGGRQLALPWCPPASVAAAYYAYDVECGQSPGLAQYYLFEYLTWTNMLVARSGCNTYSNWPAFDRGFQSWGALFYPADPSQPMIIQAKHRNCTIDVSSIYFMLNSTSYDWTGVYFYGYDWDGNLVGEMAQTANGYSNSYAYGFEGIASLHMCTTMTCTNMTQQLLVFYLVLGEKPTMAPTAPTMSPTRHPTSVNTYKLTDVAINRGNIAPRGFGLSGLYYMWGGPSYDYCLMNYNYPFDLPFPITYMGQTYSTIYYNANGYLALGGYAYPYSFDQYAGYYGVPVIYLLAQYNMYMCKLGYKTDYSTYFMITVKGSYYMYPESYYQMEIMFSNSNVTGLPRSLMEVRVLNLMNTPTVSGMTNGTNQWVKGRKHYFDYATTSPTESPTEAPTPVARRDLQDATGSPTPSRVTYDEPYTFNSLGVLRSGNYSSFVVDITTAVPIFYPEAYLDDDMITDVVGTPFPTMNPTTAFPTTTPTLVPTQRPTTAPTLRPTAVNAFVLNDMPLLFGDMAPRVSSSLTWTYAVGGPSFDSPTYNLYSAYGIPLTTPVTLLGETYTMAYISTQGMIQFGGYCFQYQDCYWSPWTGSSPYPSLYVMGFNMNGICNIKYATDGSTYTIISVKGFNANLGWCTEGNSYQYDVVFSNTRVNGEPRGLVEVRLGPNMGTNGYSLTSGLSNGTWVKGTRAAYDYVDAIPTKAPTEAARRDLQSDNSTETPTQAPSSTDAPTQAPTPQPTLSPTRAKVLYTSAYTMSSFEITPDGGYTNYVLDVTNKYGVVYYPGAYLNDTYSGDAIGTKFPTTVPTLSPTQQPTAPTIAPTGLPTLTPTGVPSASPTTQPTSMPTSLPTTAPSASPTVPPTEMPTAMPTTFPTTAPTSLPTTVPTTMPTQTPTEVPTTMPTTQPTTMPSTMPTTMPTLFPTTLPTTAPTRHPYPMLKSFTVVHTTSSSITATLSATKAGYAWCLALASASVTADPLGATVKASAQGYSVLGGEDVRTNVTMTGLIALTDYTVYCYTEDTSSPANKLFDSLVAEWKQTATTRCCYRLTTPSLPSSLYVSTASSALTLTSPVSGSIGPTVTIQYRYYSPSDAAATCNTSAFATATSSMWNDSQALLSISPAPRLSFAARTSQAFTLYTTVGGCYQITYNITGVARASWFYPPSVAFFVLDSDSTPLAPVLSSALFADSGAQVFISFGSDTDQAALTGSWSCSSLFTFARASEATCAWANYTTVIATLSSTATLVPGDSIELIAQKVRPRCTARKTYKCLTWPYATASTVTLAKPLNALLPTPSLVFASTISGCDSLMVDASASKGSGGRNMWYRWSVQSPSGADVSNITTYLDSINGLTASSTQYGVSKLELTRHLLTAPATYSFVLSLYNFLGYSMDSKAAVVSVVSDFIPTVKITGPAVRTVYRTAALSLFAQASISECSLAKTLSYRWSLIGPSALFSSTSWDPRAFRLPPNSLEAGTTYNVTVTVTDNLGQASNASTQVVVIRSPLVAIINGGVGDRTVGKSTLLTMDGTASYDPDAPTASLGYNWTCIRGGKNYGKPCDLSFDPSTPMTSVAANTASVGVYLWTLLAYDSATARTATSTAAITVQADTPPKIAISGITTPKVNPSAKLAIVATVADDSGNFTARWSLISGSLRDGVSLSSVVRTPLIKWASEAEELTSFSFPMVILAGSLAPKTTYVFTLSSVNNQAISGFSVLSFSTTGPPTSGYLRVAPTVGVALIDKFSLWSENWTDDEDAFPLSYGFSYSDGSGDGVEYVLTSEQTSLSYSPVYLPLGKGVNSTLELITIVTNLYDASARATATISVTRPTESISELKGNVSDLLGSALEAFDSDKMMSVIGAMAGLMATEDDDPDLRTDLLAFVANASTLQDASLTSVNQQACLVAKLLPDSPANLTTAALDTTLSLVGSMSANSEELGISTSTATALGSTVSSLLNLVPSSPQNLTGNETEDHSVRSMLSASVSAIALAGTVSLTAGEDPFLISSPNLNVTSDVSNPDETRGKTMGPPGTTSGLALPSDGLGAIYDTDGLESVAMSVVAMPNLYAASSTQNVSSGVVRFSLLGLESGSRRRRRLTVRPDYTRRLAEHAEGGRRLSSSGSLTPFYMTLDTQPTNYTIELEYFNMSCAKNEVGVKNHTCAVTGEVYYLQCSGRKGLRNYTCGAKTASLCSIWTGETWDSSACEIIDLTATQVRCACYNATQLLEGVDNSTSDSARRRLYGKYYDEEEEEDGYGDGYHRDLRRKRRPKSRVPDDEVSSAGAEFGAVISSVGVGIAATFAVAKTLNASVLSKNFVVFLTMGLVLFLTVCLGYWAHRKDLADKKKAAEEEEEEEETDKTTAQPGSDGPSGAEAGEEKRMRWLIQESLPTFARVRNYWNLLCSVLKTKHDWASIVFVYDEGQPRLIRVVVMTTALITIMFANAALNSQVNPDPTVCDAFIDAEGCLAGKSQVDPSATQCLWNAEDQVCSFNEDAAGSLFAVIVVAVLSTMFAVPPLMFIDYLGSNILVASIKGAKTRGDKGPTEADEGKSRSNSKAARVMALPTQDEDPDDDDDASLDDVSMTDMTMTVNGEASKPQLRPAEASSPQPRPGGLATLSQRLSPSNLRTLQASMRQTMTNALTARQQRKEDKRQREEEQTHKVKEETRKALAIVQLQRAQLLRAIDLTEVEVRDQMMDQARNRKKGSWVRGRAVTVEQNRLRQLQAFRTQFEKKWQLNQDGTFRTLAWWERWLLGRVPVTVAMERRIKHELKTVDKMEEELNRLEGDARELQLLEYSRLDFLNHTERKVYLKNKVEIDDGEELPPVSAFVYYVSWAFIVLYNMGLAFYVCLFGVQQGASVTNAWLVAFVVGLLQDILVYGPAILIFFETILPLFVRYKIKEELDAGRSDPIVFVDQIPPGPATRVALRHPDWLASKIIAATNTPKEAAAIASSPRSGDVSPASINGPSSPGLASPRMLGGVKASIYSPRSNANMRLFGQEVESFFLREVKAKNRWIMRILAYVFLSAFLTLPGGLQEFLVEQMVPVVTGLMVVGFDALHKLANGAIAGPILFFFLCLYLIVLAFSERLRTKSYHTLLYLCSCGTWSPPKAVQPPPQGPNKEQAVEPTRQAPSGAGSAGFVPPPVPLLELSQSRFARTQARKAMEEETTNTPTPPQPSSPQREARGSPSSSRKPAPRVKVSLVDASNGDNTTRS